MEPSTSPDNIDFTQVMDEQRENAAVGNSGTHLSDIISGSDQAIETVDLAADSSVEFRRMLEKSGSRYKILKLIAEGGFGRIFLAQDLILGRKVVIKSLKEKHLARPESVRKFIAEAKLNAQLDHPAIVPLYSLDTDSADGLHLAMQLVNGITLKEYLKRCRERQREEPPRNRRYERSLQVRLESFLRVCDAIEYCHSRGIIHCDLKPENIMLGRHGEVYVMDWGIACPEGTDRKGHLDGTPSYIAPETFRDGAATQQTDVFALGMILNEIVTLRDPVTGADFKEVITRVCAGEFEPSTPLNPRIRISKALRAVIEKARAVDPADRYRNVKLLAADVRHYLFNEEVAARPDSPLQKLMRFMYRHRYATLLTMAAIFCISAAMAIYGVRREQCVAEQVNLEMMRRLKVQGVTEQAAMEINSRLLRIREQLKGLSTSMGIELVKPERGGDTTRFYLSQEFAPGLKERPSGLFRMPFYNQEISLENAAYFKPESMPRSELEPLVRQLRVSRRQGLALILDNVQNEEGETLSSEESLRCFRERGSLLRRITYLFDNGVVLRFPGMYEAVASPDEFQCSWLRKQREREVSRMLWSPPYPDTSGHAVVSCWLPILNPAGKEIGLTGFELCFHELVKPLFQLARSENYQTLCFLLDADGNQIFSTEDQDFEEAHYRNAAETATTKRPFRYPELLCRLRDGGSPQFIARLDGRPVRVSWAKIPQAGWTLVRIVPPGTADRIDRVLDEANRHNIEQEINLERELFVW